MAWTLEQLRTFATVAELRTMTAAAERLGYTVGAISQQMSGLQAAVGEPLFAKSGRYLSLTDAGRILLTHAHVLVDAERKAHAALSGAPSDHEATVILGVFGSAAVFAIRPVLAQVRATAPHVVLRAREIDVERMPQAVLDEEIDIALGLDYSNAPIPPQRGLATTSLHREVFQMVLPPAAAEFVGNKTALRNFVNETDWILPPLDTAFGKAARFACAAAGFDARVVHTVTDTAVSIALAEAGVGLTIATEMMLVLRPTDSPLAPLSESSSRDVVALARVASLERPSVSAVHDALVHVFSR